MDFFLLQVLGVRHNDTEVGSDGDVRRSPFDLYVTVLNERQFDHKKLGTPLAWSVKLTIVLTRSSFM